jgi:predicted neuraminidase
MGLTKVFWWIMVLFFSINGFSQSKYQIPPLSKPGEGALMKAELIYPLDSKPTPQCHASTIVEVKEGLIAAWFGGTAEGHEDVGIWVSRNLEGKWSKPVEVANGLQINGLRYPCWNSVLFYPSNGPLMLFYKEGPNPRDWWGMITTSSDAGRTWSKPKKLGENRNTGHLLGPVKNKPVQLQDGTIICPSSTERTKNRETLWKVHFEITKDRGKTWDVIGPINDGIEFDAIQPSVLIYADGKMQILCRTREGVIPQSWSTDKGKTWSKMAASGLPNPNSGIDAVSLTDGRQLLVYNHTTRSGNFPRGRNMLNLAISEDGKNWKPVMTLERQKGEYSYPAVIQVKTD